MSISPDLGHPISERLLPSNQKAGHKPVDKSSGTLILVSTNPYFSVSLSSVFILAEVNDFPPLFSLFAVITRALFSSSPGIGTISILSGV